MVAIFQKYSNTFSWMKIYKFSIIEICSQAFNEQYSSIGLVNGLAPARWQAIIWTNNC